MDAQPTPTDRQAAPPPTPQAPKERVDAAIVAAAGILAGGAGQLLSAIAAVTGSGEAPAPADSAPPAPPAPTAADASDKASG